MVNVSIIMPLFNAGRYLPEALDSVLGQTYKDFELICVDDCSTDQTGETLLNFQERDKRIRILTNERRLGAGLSRNRGLENAKGKYILFLDGDDVFEEELLEKAYEVLEETEADVAGFEYMRVPSEKIYVKRTKQRPKSYIDSYCRAPFSIEDFSSRDFPNRSNSPCDKMFRKQFLLENCLKFQDLPSFNDVYFAKMALYCAKKIIYLEDRRIMVYARDHSQPSRISNDRNPMYGYYAMERLAAELREREMFPEIAEYYYYTLSLTIMDSLIIEEKNKERQKSFYNFLKNTGIATCIQYGGNSYAKADWYDRDLLKGLQDNTWESRWFHNVDTYFQYYLKRNGKRLCRWIEEQLKQEKTIIVWGAGINGKSLLDYIREYGLEISGVVDSDEAKQGTVVSGYEVLKPEVLAKGGDYFVFTSKQVYQEAKDIADEWQAVLVNGLDIVTEEPQDYENSNRMYFNDRHLITERKNGE